MFTIWIAAKRTVEREMAKEKEKTRKRYLCNMMQNRKRNAPQPCGKKYKK
jgi:hypothetical protein